MRIAGLLALALLLPIVVFASGVNINTANAALLDTLPGIGPSKAAAIIEYRTTNGPFAAISDIQKVKGIGPATFANLQSLITVGEVSVEQPAVPAASSKEVQEARLDETPARQVEPISNTTTNIQINDEAVTAPTTAVEPAVVGAAPPPVATSRAAGLFHSPWTLGLLGVIVVASGIFILL